MPWTPTITLLGTVKELETFSYSIQYYEEIVSAPEGGGAGGEGDAGGGEPTVTIVYYPVYIVPEINKATITATPEEEPEDPATVAGYYKYIFYDRVEYRGYSNNIVTLTGDENSGAWEKLDLDNAFEMTDFDPDRTRDITFSFTANAVDGDAVIASQEFTVRVYDPNWTNGKNALKAAVAATIAKD